MFAAKKFGFLIQSTEISNVNTCKIYIVTLIKVRRRDNNTLVGIYHISSKSRRSEILFQGPVWCSDNSRAAKFRGRRLYVATEIDMQLHYNKPICMHI